MTSTPIAEYLEQVQKRLERIDDLPNKYQAIIPADVTTDLSKLTRMVGVAVDEIERLEKYICDDFHQRVCSQTKGRHCRVLKNKNETLKQLEEICRES